MRAEEKQLYIFVKTLKKIAMAKNKTKPRINNSFIEEGKIRVELCLRRAFAKEEYKHILESFPTAPRMLSKAYLHFASCSIEKGEQLPTALLLSAKWLKMRDWSLSEVERSFFIYLDVVASYRDGDLEAWRRDNAWDNVMEEALFDCQVEDGRIDIDARRHLKAMLNKYLRAIRVEWEDGKEFNALLEINPTLWELPDFQEQYNGIEYYGANSILPKSREEAVLGVLGKSYYLGLEARNEAFPSLRRIAKEEGIRYSEILEALNIMQKL